MRASILIVAGLLFAASPSALATGQRAFLLVPGVLVDPGAGTVFAMTPAGGIDALALDSGTVSWSKDVAAKPLALFGDGLVAQAEGSTTLNIVLLDPRNGNGSAKGISLALPADVAAQVDDGLGTRMAVRTALGDGELLLHWAYTRGYVSPIPPAPGQPMKTVREAAYRLDTASRRATPIDVASFDLAQRTAPGRVPDPAFDSAIGIVRLDDVVAGTQVVGQGDRQRIVLKKWDLDGTAHADRTLFTGPHILQYASADGRHVLVSERRAPGTLKEYSWSLYSLATGAKLGAIDQRQSVSPFFVSARTVTFVDRPHGRRIDGRWRQFDRTLKQVALDGGEVLWERPLRDTKYYGPFRP